MLALRLIQGMSIGFPSGFRAESTREIEDQTSHENNANCSTTEHRAAKIKSPGDEQKSQ
jgi:hypothetical protein